MKTIEITEQQAKEMFDSGIPSLRSIAETNYPELFKKKIEWKDFSEVEGYYVNQDSEIVVYKGYNSSEDNKNIFPTEEEAEACLALSQLCQWRDKYNENWKPNYNDNNVKYQIFFNRDQIFKAGSYYSRVLSFKTEEIRNKFLEDFTELIIECKSLL